MINKNYNLQFGKYSPLSLSYLLMGVLLFCLMGSNFALAQADTVAQKDGTGAQLFCKRDFSNFLANGIDLNGEGFIDYWADIVDIPFVYKSRYSSNYCRFLDIDSLLNRIDKVRKQIRQAFFVCDSNTTSRLKSQYYELSAEIYYLRHFVDISNPPSSEATPEEKDLAVRKKEGLWVKFREMFVLDAEYFDDSVGETLFLKLEEKYKNKIVEYQNCQDPNLSALKDKITQLTHTLDAVGQLGKRFEKRVTSRFVQAEKRIKANPGIFGGYSSGDSGGFLNNIVDFRINGENGFGGTAWEQLKGGFDANNPELFGQLGKSAQATFGSIPESEGGVKPALTFDSVYGDFKTARRRDENADADLSYLAELDLKYRQTSGIGLDKVKINLDKLIEIIDQTKTPMGAIQDCTTSIVTRQCENKPV